MARTQKDIVSYFPHDANACLGDTLTVLQSRFGNDGYAFWFKLLEKLASTDGHYLDCQNPTKWQLLLAKAGVNEITGVEIMKLLVEMEAIDRELWESKLIWCQKLVDNVADVYKNRGRNSPLKPISTNGYGLTTEKKAITTDDSTQSKVKESKVNKVNKDIYLIPEFIDKDTWEAFLEMREKKRAVPTERAKRLLVEELEKLKGEGNDPNEVLKQSIMRNYTGVFPVKEDRSGAHIRSTKIPQTYTELPADPDLEADVEADRRSRSTG